MGKMQRTKGRRAQTEFAKMLTSRDWEIVETSSGMKVEDIVAHDPQGGRWSVEVKNHKLLNVEAFVKQAKEQAAKRSIPWMLAMRIPRYAETWLILRKGDAAVWRGDKVVRKDAPISHEDAL